jgi:G3E family GTPase
VRPAPRGGIEETLARIEQRVRQANPSAHIIRTSGGRVDPELLFDIACNEEAPGQLPFAAALRETGPRPRHQHAAVATVHSPGPVEPGLLIDPLESSTPGAYRIKGHVTVQSGRGMRGYVVNLVGRSIHIVSAPATGRKGPALEGSDLVAVGLHLDAGAARRRLEQALQTAGTASAEGYRRLQRYRRLSQ